MMACLDHQAQWVTLDPLAHLDSRGPQDLREIEEVLGRRELWGFRDSVVIMDNLDLPASQEALELLDLMDPLERRDQGVTLATQVKLDSLVHEVLLDWQDLLEFLEPRASRVNLVFKDTLERLV